MLSQVRTIKRSSISRMMSGHLLLMQNDLNLNTHCHLPSSSSSSSLSYSSRRNRYTTCLQHQRHYTLFSNKKFNSFHQWNNVVPPSESVLYQHRYFTSKSTNGNNDNNNDVDGISNLDKDKQDNNNDNINNTSSQNSYNDSKKSSRQLILDQALQKPVGSLFGNGFVSNSNDEQQGPSSREGTTVIRPSKSQYFIPQVQLHDMDGSRKKRVLVLCTGGTLTMAPDPYRGGSLAPVQGAVTSYMKEMKELLDDNMPEVVIHEYSPFLDSSDLGPNEWAVLANDIKANYLHFDGFVVLMGTDTMAYAASALSFMLENLGKPVVFTGSQIPLSEPYNDARRNLIMALIFACRDTIPEVSIFFHDRLLRACRATKVNTHRLLAFDSPNLDPLAKIGITIEESEHLTLPPVRGPLRVHARMDTRLITLRLVPGFDDEVVRHLVESNVENEALKVLVLQMYGTGNIPSRKESLLQVLRDAVDKGIMVIASTQCFTGSVMMGHYATGHALAEIGVVSANDMTLEAISTKVGYLMGRGDLTHKEIASLMNVSLRGEVTPSEALPPPPLSSTYQRASRKGKRFY